MDITLQRLQQLRNKGFKPKFTLDIGACVGEWARDTKIVFPESEYLLLEANKDHEPILKNTGFPYKIALLGNESKMVDYYAKKEGYTTGNSIFIEQTKHYTGDQFETRQLSMVTLDDLLRPYKMNKPEFVKLDVQGAEILVLQGATKTLENCEFILLETQLLEYNKNAPMFTDIVGLYGLHKLSNI